MKNIQYDLIKKMFCILFNQLKIKVVKAIERKKGSNETVNDLSKLGTRDEWRGNRRTKKEHIRHFKPHNEAHR